MTVVPNAQNKLFCFGEIFCVILMGGGVSKCSSLRDGAGEVTSYKKLATFASFFSIHMSIKVSITFFFIFNKHIVKHFKTRGFSQYWISGLPPPSPFSFVPLSPYLAAALGPLAFSSLL